MIRAPTSFIQWNKEAPVGIAKRNAGALASGWKKAKPTLMHGLTKLEARRADQVHVLRVRSQATAGGVQAYLAINL